MDSKVLFSGIAANAAFTQAGPFGPQAHYAVLSAKSTLSLQLDGRELGLLPEAMKPEQQGDTVQFRLTINPDHTLKARKIAEYRDGKKLDVPFKDNCPVTPGELEDFCKILVVSLCNEHYTYTYKGTDERVPLLKKAGRMAQDDTKPSASFQDANETLKEAVAAFAARLKTIIDLSPKS